MEQYPADNIGQNNLAFCYGRLLNMPKAMEEARRGLQLTPKDLMARMNFALYACYAGDFQACGREASEALELNPSYEEAFFAQAYAELGQDQLQQASETYQKLQKSAPGVPPWRLPGGETSRSIRAGSERRSRYLKREPPPT